MCGRFALRMPPKELAEILDIVRGYESIHEWRPRYNVAPTTQVLCVRMTEARERELFPAKWGLIPIWSKDDKFGASCINARSETVDTKPTFRAAFKRRRCLVIADGFYEWQKLDAKNKQPYYVTLRSGEPMPFAGLWECWQPTPDSPVVESCTICTTSANSMMAELHDRMPVILPRAMFDHWLDPAIVEPDAIKPLLAQFPSVEMRAWPVDKRVGNVRNDDPSLIEPIDI